MSHSDIQPGCVLIWDGFVKADGTKEAKLFVVVGCHPKKYIVVIRATSKKRHRDYVAEDGADYYFIPGGGKEFFDEDTWLLFSEPTQFDRGRYDVLHKAKEVRVMGYIRFQVVNEICNKMRVCEDVSEYYRDLLGPPLKAAQTLHA